jgi:hypothetical protein
MIIQNRPDVPSKVLETARKLGQIIVNHRKGPYKYDTTPFHEDIREREKYSYYFTIWVPLKDIPLTYKELREYYFSIRISIVHAALELLRQEYVHVEIESYYSQAGFELEEDDNIKIYAYLKVL